MPIIDFEPNSKLPDGGLWYAETNPHAIIVEPHNTWTAALFIAIAGWWIFKLYPARQKYSFLFASSIVLMVGAIGGTIYHAFRWSAFFIMMDWLPILLLCLMASVYFLFRTFNNIKIALGIISTMLMIVITVWNIGDRSGHYNINVNYSLMAITVLGSVWLYMHKIRYRYSGYVLVGIICFALALTFRIVDQQGILPQGTHFIWHLFGLGACHSMFTYIYRSRPLIDTDRIRFRKLKINKLSWGYLF
jgi:hemolysin III